MFRIERRRFGRQLDLVITARVIILMIVASNILMFLLERNNYKSKEDVLFVLELVTFPKSVQLVLSPVIIVKRLDIIIEVFVQQSLKSQMKVILRKLLLRKLLLTLVQLTLINHHNLIRKILNLQQW